MSGRTVFLTACRTYGPLEAPPQRNLIISSGEYVRLFLTVYDHDGDPAPLNMAGLAAFFSFGGEGRGRDGTFLPFETGQVYFDLLGGMTRYSRGQIPWRVTLGGADEASVIASGAINILSTSGHRLTRSATLVTPVGNPLEGDGSVIAVPEDGSDTGVGPATLLWGDGSALGWEDGSTVDYE